MKCKEPPEWYSELWSRPNPGLMIIMLDRSRSMRNIYEGMEIKADYASKWVNRMIDTIIQKNFDGESPKNRCFISVMGYDHDVKELCSGFLKDLDANPMRVEHRVKKQLDGAGGFVDVPYDMLIWIEPEFSDEEADLSVVFSEVKKIIHDRKMSGYLIVHQPVVINITGGLDNYDAMEIKDKNVVLDECLFCNVLCKPDNEISDEERLFWASMSSSEIPGNVAYRMGIDGYDKISSLFFTDFQKVCSFISSF